MTRLNFIDLNLNELSQELCRYPLIVSLDKCCECYDTIDDPSNKKCVSNKTEDFDLKCI